MFKQYKSQPTDSAFFQKHAAAITGFMAAVTLAQVISALTEAGIIYKIVEDSLVMFPVLAAVAGAIAAAAGVAMIELFGIRYALPYGVRGIIEKFRGTADQQKSADWTITILFIFIAAGLLLLSFNLSDKGSQMTIENISDRQQGKQTLEYKLEAKNERSATIADFKADSASVAAIWSKKIETKSAAYDSELAALQTKLEQRTARQERTGKSYRSSIERYNRQIDEKQAQKTAAVAALTDSLTTALAAERKRLRTNLRQINSDRDTRISTATEKVESKEGAWSNTAKWLIPICILIQLIGIVIRQWFRFRAGIETRLIVSEYYFRPSAWDEWKESRAERIQQKLRAEIAAFESKTLAPPEIRTPHILTDFQDFVQPSARLKIEGRKGGEAEFKKAHTIEEKEILKIVKHTEDMKQDGMELQASIREIEAKEVIEIYLKRNGQPVRKIEVEKLYNNIAEYIAHPETVPNPFDETRQQIGFKQKGRDSSASVINATVINGSDKMTAYTRPVAVPSRSCQHCSKDVSHKRSDAKFCNDSCRKSYWKDKNGGKEFDANLYHKTK